MTHLIGLTTAPMHRLKPFSDDELKEGSEWIQMLSKDHNFKPGEIKRKSTQSYSRAMTTGCIKAINSYHGIETCFPASETYNAATERSSDILGVVDVIVMESHPIPRNRWIQACRKDWQSHIKTMADYNHINRCRRILANPTHTLELWGWASYPGYKKDGTKAATRFWYPRVQILSMAFLLNQEPPTYAKFWET